MNMILFLRSIGLQRAAPANRKGFTGGTVLSSRSALLPGLPARRGTGSLGRGRKRVGAVEFAGVLSTRSPHGSPLAAAARDAQRDLEREAGAS